jgi:hypothetical protein
MVAIREVPAGIPMDEARSLTAEFVRHWDQHRMPYFDSGISTPWEFFRVDAAFAVLATILLTTFRRAVPSSARLLVIGLLAITTVATAYTVTDEISPGFFGGSVGGLLIPRLLNWNSVALPVLVISLLGYLALERRSVVGLVGLAVIVPALNAPAAVSLGGLLVLALVSVPGGIRRRLQPLLGISYPRTASRTVGGLVVLACAALFSLSMLDSRNLDLDEGSPVWTEAGQGEGLIIAPPPLGRTQPSVHWPQLRTARGVLVDGGLLNVMSYARAAAPAMEEILNDIYGTSIRDTANDSFFSQSQALWERRTVRDWQRIGAEYGATNVIADSSWEIELPQTAAGSGGRYHSQWEYKQPEGRDFFPGQLRLYQIPPAR